MADYTFPVEAGHIMLFARSVGDPNPIYADAEYAAGTEVGGIVAPPTFVQASAQFNPDYFLRPKIGQPWFGSGREPTGLAPPAPSSGGGSSGGGGGRGRRRRAPRRAALRVPPAGAPGRRAHPDHRSRARAGSGPVAPASSSSPSRSPSTGTPTASSSSPPAASASSPPGPPRPTAPRERDNEPVESIRSRSATPTARWSSTT